MYSNDNSKLNTDELIEDIKEQIQQERIERESVLENMTSEEQLENYKNVNKVVNEIDSLLGIETVSVRDYYANKNKGRKS